MIYWIKYYTKRIFNIAKYVWYILKLKSNYYEVWKKLVSKDLIQYDYIRNALISITTSYLITILVKIDTLNSMVFTAALFLSWFFMFAATLIFLRIFFVLHDIEEEYISTKLSSTGRELVDFKVTESINKIIITQKVNDNILNDNYNINEVRAKKWISLIKIFIVMTLMSLLILSSISIYGYFLNNDTKPTTNHLERIHKMQIKIDSLITVIDSYNLNNKVYFDSIYNLNNKVYFDSICKSINRIEGKILIPSSRTKIKK